ncbi:hypothetical protein FOA52_013450 [Chlamydomonas sp. UWO 241]|nr:hypothetical protein FOA52_013450 [Chlamydomonas sp. UWO 241]
MATSLAAADAVIGAFTPGHAAFGGLVIGMAVAMQLLLTGRVLGMSGAVKGIVQRTPGLWRYAFVGGMLVASVPLAMLVPSSFVPLPDTYTYVRALGGGLLVGLGSALGNGCTSGHSICGMSRFSVRSIIYTVVYMAAGAVGAALTGSLAASGVPTDVAPALVWPTLEVLTPQLQIAAAGAAAFAALAFAGSHMGASKAKLEGIATLAVGGVFASGLAFSGMTLPAKVAGFLSPLLRGWDASLAFVMGGALVVGSIAYQSVLGGTKLLPPSLRSIPVPGGKPGAPLLLSSYNLPSGNVIDPKLLTGGVLFGAGWGISGMCPGPAIVAFAGSAGVRAFDTLAGAPAALEAAAPGSCLCAKAGAYIVAMIAGMLIEPYITRALFSAAPPLTPPPSPTGPPTKAPASKFGNPSEGYASAHMTASARASKKLANVHVRAPIAVLGNHNHFRSFIRDDFNSKPRGPLPLRMLDHEVQPCPIHKNWDIIVYSPPLHLHAALPQSSPAVAAIHTDVIEHEVPLACIEQICLILTGWMALPYVVPRLLFMAVVNQEVQPCPIHKNWDIIVYTPPPHLHVAPPQSSPAVTAIRTDVIEHEAPLVNIVQLCPTGWMAPPYVVPRPLSVVVLNQEMQPCLIHKNWDIIVYMPPLHLHVAPPRSSPAVAANRTDIIVDEAPLVNIVQLSPAEWMAPPYVVPRPLSVAMLDQEVQPCLIQKKHTKMDIILCTPPVNLHMAPLDHKVMCKDTIVTDAAVCILTDGPSSGEASPASSSGGADALQLALSMESQTDEDAPQLASQFYTSAPQIEVHPEVSCAGVKGDGELMDVSVSEDSSGCICLSNEPSPDDLNTHSSRSESGQCTPSVSCSMASTIPSSPARTIKMRPENRPRTFAEVVSGRIATHVTVTAVNLATGARTTKVAQGERAVEATAAVAPMSSHTTTTTTTRPRT